MSTRFLIKGANWNAKLTKMRPKYFYPTFCETNTYNFHRMFHATIKIILKKKLTNFELFFLEKKYFGHKNIIIYLKTFFLKELGSNINF